LTSRPVVGRRRCWATALHLWSVGGDLGDLSGAQGRTLRPPIRAMDETQHHNAAVAGNLPVTRPVGEGGNRCKQRGEDGELQREPNRADHAGVSSAVRAAAFAVSWPLGGGDEPRRRGGRRASPSADSASSPPKRRAFKAAAQ